MIVYGDPRFDAPAYEIIGWMQTTVRSLDPANLQALRSALIKAGQLEQAIADADMERLPAFQRLTDLLARAFAARLEGATNRVTQEVAAAYKLLVNLAADTTRSAGSATKLTVKTPEGFEFYALYPEQYVLAARRWATEREAVQPKLALAVGIRAIGTTLSAVVAAVLETAGWKTARLTVRPWGHPFHRELALSNVPWADAAHALIVDEGPGMSGSSMAATARALHSHGFVPERMSFFPSHPAGPGLSASPEVRRWWEMVPQFCARLEDVHWSHRASEALDPSGLLKAAASTLAGPRVYEQIQSVGGGLWRAAAYSDESEWPAVCARFEAPKFLCSAADGTRVLWKFVGLGGWVNGKTTASGQAAARATKLAKEILAPPSLGLVEGFLAQPWIEGKRLTQADAHDPQILQHIARYVAQSTGPCLAPSEHVLAVRRLRDMACHNCCEAFGSGPNAEWLACLCSRAENTPRVSAGDGHLAPHEWVRIPSGRILKTDALGHAGDHTVVGAQSVLWDVASVLLEWGLAKDARTGFLSNLAKLGLEFGLEELRFYEAAYAAFRLGQTAFCLALEPSESAEHARLAAARNAYSRALLQLLSARDGGS